MRTEQPRGRLLSRYYTGTKSVSCNNGRIEKDRPMTCSGRGKSSMGRQETPLHIRIVWPWIRRELLYQHLGLEAREDKVFHRAENFALTLSR